MPIIQLSELLENYNYHDVKPMMLLIIQLSELLENYNWTPNQYLSYCIIQLSELLENYNHTVLTSQVSMIIQLSELLENYNKKSAHHWVGNFSLQILTDLHPSKIPLHGEFPVSQAPAFGLGDTICGKECGVQPRFSPYATYPKHGISATPIHATHRTKPLRGCFTQSLRRRSLPH